MLDFIVAFLKELGIFGLLISLAIEASSLPFPGGIVVLAYGYVLKSSAWASFGIAILAGLVYTAFSYIPYYIGRKLDHKVKNWFKTNKIDKAERWFKRCGEWTIALSRPLGLGNYISYFSGLSNVKPVRFGSITFIGIFPWIYAMLLLGKMGNLQSMKQMLSSFQQYVFIGIAIIVLCIIGFKAIQKRRKTTPSPKSYSNTEKPTL
ncbi:DedA family protein [Pontibacillus salicampi]|uniref:DedA family protein n=1 Tax=Pontibacillus salicampi TaxID=1449801 RepID=A0ABV6LIK3_9BACI